MQVCSRMRLEQLDLEAAQKLIVQLKASLQARELQLERNMEEVASVRGNMEQVMVSLLPARRPLADLVMTPLIMHAQAFAAPRDCSLNTPPSAPGEFMLVRRGA